jgi:hypothetical protein
VGLRADLNTVLAKRKLRAKNGNSIVPSFIDELPNPGDEGEIRETGSIHGRRQKMRIHDVILTYTA